MTLAKLEQAINKYLTMQGTARQRGTAKAQITKLVNVLVEKLTPHELRQTVLALIPTDERIDGRAESLRQRFTTGSLYDEGDRVFGWWDGGDIQIQAEELPLHRDGKSHTVSFYGFGDSAGLWRSRGFDVAQKLPTFRNDFGMAVNLSVTASAFWLAYGYALPCELPWRRGESDDHVPCIWVTRSIIGAGFWQAYKWWEGCRWWYYDKHPEWFADDPLWGDWEPKPVYWPAPEPDSAVLGGGSNP